MTDLLKALSAPFDPARVSWRVGATTQAKDKGMALAYVDSRDVQDRFDQVCGMNWQCRYSHTAAKTVCDIGVLFGDTWIWRADGAGDTDVEQEKGALSDAFKRAAVKFGVGRYLYDIESPWVAIVKKGNSYVIAEHELVKLQKLLPGSKAVTATDNQNGPGVTKARTWMSAHVHELHGLTTADEFMDAIEAGRAYWVRIKREYPGLWFGPDGSGLRGDGIKIATIFDCRDRFDEFLKAVENMAAETTTKQAAE